MQFELVKTIQDMDSATLFIGLTDNNVFPEYFTTLNHQFQRALTSASGSLSKLGDIAWVTDKAHPPAVLFHCGSLVSFDRKSFKTILHKVTSVLKQYHINNAAIALPQIQTETPDWQVQETILHCHASIYEFNEFKSKPDESTPVKTIQIIQAHASDANLKDAIHIAEGIEFTKKLCDRPANHCTPTYLAEEALRLAKTFKAIKTKIYDEKAIQKMKMGSFLSVARGSDEPPRFIEIKYSGAGKDAPIVFVGKGVTFDSGGTCIKPASGMEEMKYDMGGAASVLGVLKACALMNLPLNIIGLIPATENMPGGKATKPGDVVTSYSGQTIEIINTDAEGRLIMADALTYAEQFNPEFVIDIATLTGAVIVALGHEASGLMTEDDELAEAILTAGKKADDIAWRLPLLDVYQPHMDSKIADMHNAASTRAAGSITAACFLARFAKKFRWAHLDIAGTAWVSGKNRQATGRPVALLMTLLKDRANAR